MAEEEGNMARHVPTGRIGTILFYDPTDPDMTYKLQFPGELPNWFRKAEVVPLNPEGLEATRATGDIRIGKAPPPPPRPTPPPSRFSAPTRLHEPLLTGNRSTGSSATRNKCRLGWNIAYLAVAMIVSFIVFSVAFTRNLGCNPADLMADTPPYGGELIPDNVTLKERVTYFQFSKMVDVYDNAKGMKHVGYFYDMNMFFIKRFGFSDAEDRIWFEAKYPWSSYFSFGLRYVLQRCDVGANGRTGGIFDVVEDYSQRPWFCWSSCKQVFNIARANAAQSSSDYVPVAHVQFNSKMENIGVHWNQYVNAWFMNMTDPHDGSQLAYAQQRFYWSSTKWNAYTLSRWGLDVVKEENYLPNWVAGFMAALDDIEEDK